MDTSILDDEGSAFLSKRREPFTQLRSVPFQKTGIHNYIAVKGKGNSITALDRP